MFRKNFQNQIRNVSIRNFRSTFKPGQEYETIKLERKGQLSGRVLHIKILRVVQTQSILFLKLMSERDGSDIERL